MAGRQAAQNQHYVPKFILRNFLRAGSEKQVHVFSKRTGKAFTTSIDGIMAERRFHEFAIDDDYIASFEDSIGKIEGLVLPVYREVLSSRRLTGAPEERANLAFLIGFQLLRTRSTRDQFAQIDDILADKLAQSGQTLSDIEGYVPLSEQRLKMQHIQMLKSSLPSITGHLVTKQMLLLEAPAGRSFYLGDNPVCLHNGRPPDPLFGNLGLAVQGIEIYLPLSSDLMLAAYCPSLLTEMDDNRLKGRAELARALLVAVASNQITAEQMADQLSGFDADTAPATDMLTKVAAGEPILLQEENMDFCNSLQMQFAREFVICPRRDFRLASRFVNEYPDDRGFVLKSAF